MPERFPPKAAEVKEGREEILADKSPGLERSIDEEVALRRSQVAADVRALRRQRDEEREKASSVLAHMKHRAGIGPPPEQHDLRAYDYDSEARGTLDVEKYNIHTYKEGAINEAIETRVVAPLKALREAVTDDQVKDSLRTFDEATLESALKLPDVREKLITLLNVPRHFSTFGSAGQATLDRTAQKALAAEIEYGPDALMRHNRILLQPKIVQALDPEHKARLVERYERTIPRADAWPTSVLAAAAESASPERSAKLESDLAVGLTEGNARAVADTQGAEINPALKKIGEQVLDSYLTQNFGMQLAELEPYWREGGTSGEPYNLSRNLYTMLMVESAQPGGVRALSEKFGIKEFGRYPSEMLVSQLQEEEVQQPYGVVLYPRADWNNAFDQDKEALKHLYADTRGHHGLRIVEVGSSIEIARRLLAFDSKYGSQNKIGFAVVAGHGSENLVQFGKASGASGTLRQENLEQPGHRRARDFLAEDPTIVLISCSTGSEEGIAQQLSNVYDAHVIAPTVPTNVKDMRVTYDEAGKPKFAVTYNESSARAIYNAGIKEA